MEKKNMAEAKKKFNVVDMIAVVLIALLALVVLWKVLVGNAAEKPGEEEANGVIQVTYVVRAENRPVELYENAKRYIPSQLMASGKLYDGWVVGVEKEPVMVLTANGTWVEDPSRVTLYFTVEATVPNTEVMTSLVGTQEIRIGDPGYDLKTEYLEFRDTTVVDVEWKDRDFDANRG